MKADVLIVGAGHSGAQAAIQLRQQGFAGTIVLAGDENDLPYERPPLSKEYLAGARLRESLAIRPAAFWDEQRITRRPGTRIVAIDAARRVAHAASGDAIAYGWLVWATGGAPRRIGCAGETLPGVHVLRTLGDADALRAALPAARRAVVVGGGFSGLEAAAVLREAGLAVALVEAKDRLLPRGAGPIVADVLAEEHRARGVSLLLGAQVAAIEGSDRVAAVALADGTRLSCDLVLVAIGIVPAFGPLLDAGAHGGDGVSIDEGARTSIDRVLALGDVALHRPSDGRPGARIESIANAHATAAAAARTIIGLPPLVPPLPWYWSHQYDLKLQSAGRWQDHDSAIVRGDPAARSFAVLYLKRGALIGIDAVNATRDYAQGRALIERGARADPALLADIRRPLKSLLEPA